MFVFFGSGAAVASVILATGGSVISISANHGLITAIIIFLFADISGGFFNLGPLLCALVFREISVLKGFLFFIAQLFGCVAGSAMLTLMFPWHVYFGDEFNAPNGLMPNSTDYAVADKLVDLKEGNTWGTPNVGLYVNAGEGEEWKAFVAEFMGSFFLGYTLFSLIKARKTPTGVVALVMGALLFCIFIVVAPLDGSAMNTWRWLGPAVVSLGRLSEPQGPSYFGAWWVFVFAPNLGWLAGWCMARFLGPKNK